MAARGARTAAGADAAVGILMPHANGDAEFETRVRAKPRVPRATATSVSNGIHR
jgi:hypothetical protein